MILPLMYFFLALLILVRDSTQLEKLSSALGYYTDDAKGVFVAGVHTEVASVIRLVEHEPTLHENFTPYQIDSAQLKSTHRHLLDQSNTKQPLAAEVMCRPRATDTIALMTPVSGFNQEGN